MINVRLLLVCALFVFFQNCEKKVPVSPRPFNVELLPGNAKPVTLSVYKVNCWVEQEKFFVTGICTNTTSEWQKIWLEAIPLNAAGKPITISNCTSVFFSTFSDAVPPSGRTSFFVSWPLADFSEKPDSCKIKSMMAIQPAPGPILVVPATNGMKMLVPSSSGQAVQEERGWYLGSSISNPLPMEALHPRLEVLVYGNDGLLWLSTLLNPEDPAAKQIFHFEREGPLKPKEDRPFTMQVYYDGLPEVLKEKKIGRVEILPFEARQ